MSIIMLESKLGVPAALACADKGNSRQIKGCNVKNLAGIVHRPRYAHAQCVVRVSGTG